MPAICLLLKGMLVSLLKWQVEECEECLEKIHKMYLLFSYLFSHNKKKTLSITPVIVFWQIVSVVFPAVDKTNCHYFCNLSFSLSS